MSMKKFAVSLMAIAMLAGCSSSQPADGADSGDQGAEAFESTLYPTPEGVTYTASATNAAAPDWSKYDELVDEIKLHAVKAPFADDPLVSGDQIFAHFGEARIENSRAPG